MQIVPTICEPTFRSRLASLALALALGSCTSPTRGSLSTSLTNLSFETRHFDGAVLAHTEIVSIGGQLAMPDVGMIYHYDPHPVLGSKFYRFFSTGKWPDKDLPPSSVMLISRDHSFRLVGESEAAQQEPLIELQERVISVRDALIALRDLSAEGTRLSSRAALLSIERQKAQTKEKAEDNPSTGPADELQSLPESLKARMDAIDSQIKEQQTHLTSLLSKPGILIARWHRKGERSSSLKLEPVGQAQANSEREDSGLAILGGLRVCSLAIGDDFKQMLARLDESDVKTFPFGAINTYALQARFVSYVSDRVLNEEVDLGLRITRELIASKKLLDELQALEIGSYFKNFQDLSNRGDIGPIRWSKHPYCFVAGMDLPQFEKLSTPQGVYPNGAPQALESYGGSNWITVIAQLAHPALLSRARPDYLKQWNNNNLPPHKGESKRSPCSFGRCDRYVELETPEHLRAPLQPVQDGASQMAP